MRIITPRLGSALARVAEQERPKGLSGYSCICTCSHGKLADSTVPVKCICTYCGSDHGLRAAEFGRDPYDRALSDLVGELSTRSDEFRVRWAAHDVKYYRSGMQPFHHPLVGDLTLNYDALEIPADPGQTIVAYTAEPDSASQQALNLLASWTPTPDQAPADTADYDS
jgi:hypothetical protein